MCPNSHDPCSHESHTVNIAYNFCDCLLEQMPQATAPAVINGVSSSIKCVDEIDRATFYIGCGLPRYWWVNGYTKTKCFAAVMFASNQKNIVFGSDREQSCFSTPALVCCRVDNEPKCLCVAVAITVDDIIGNATSKPSIGRRVRLVVHTNPSAATQAWLHVKMQDVQPPDADASTSSLPGWAAAAHSLFHDKLLLTDDDATAAIERTKEDVDKIKV